MSSNQIIILCIMIGYLVLNVAIGMFMAKKQEAGSTMSKEKNTGWKLPSSWHSWKNIRSWPQISARKCGA